MTNYKVATTFSEGNQSFKLSEVQSWVYFKTSSPVSLSGLEGSIELKTLLKYTVRPWENLLKFGLTVLG